MLPNLPLRNICAVGALCVSIARRFLKRILTSAGNLPPDQSNSLPPPVTAANCHPSIVVYLVRRRPLHLIDHQHLHWSLLATLQP
jgi:hypothetical protein